MCYFLKCKIILQNESESQLNHFLKHAPLQQEQALRFQGNFPNYFLTNGHCSCAYIQNKGSSIHKHAQQALESILTNKNVKRIELSWHWGDNETEKPPECSLSISEFRQKNDNDQLQIDMKYRVNDPNKYIY